MHDCSEFAGWRVVSGECVQNCQMVPQKCDFYVQRERENFNEHYVL